MENSEAGTATENEKGTFRIFPFYNTRQAGFLILVLALVFYSPSVYNEYALDDGINIHMNNHVIKGIKGIKDILGKDAYHSFYERMNATDQLQGGRYRPLPGISYAIEQEIIGPYRTGYYLMTEDLNHNGILDSGMVTYVKSNRKTLTNYEYNDFVDLNKDGIAQANECYNCWDRNKNFINDPSEDLNADGIFNEIDCQVYGAKLRHFNNIVLFAVCCLLLYYFFSRHLFRENQDLAFLSALLFTIHPAFSEVVAAVKGRDDLFSLIFILLCFIYSFRFTESKQFRHLAAAGFFMLLALLSKEFAVALYLLVPLALYVHGRTQTNSFRHLSAPFITFVVTAALLIFCDIRGLYPGAGPGQFYLLVALVYLGANLFFIKAIREREIAALLTGLFAAGIIYLCMRLNAVNMAPGVPDTEILNNPFLLASGAEAFATKIYNLLLYLRIYLFPHPLVADYSYATIAYRQPADWDFILSLVLNGALLITGITLAVKKHVLGFALLTYYVFILFVSNLFFFTGTMLLESYLFHPGMGMSVVIAWLMLWIFQRFSVRQHAGGRSVMLVFITVLIAICGYKAWERSRDWKNDVTLFLKDVKKAPNSVLVLGNAGARWIDLADTKEITGLWLTGSDTTRYNDYNGQLVITDEEVKDAGYKDKREAALYRGIGYLERAVELHPRYVNGFLNLGLAYFKLGREKEAIFNWKYAEYLYPHNPYLNNYYHVFTKILRERGASAFEEKHYRAALESYRKITTIYPEDVDGWKELGRIYDILGRHDEARKCRDKAENLDPVNKKDRETNEFIGPHAKDRTENPC